MAARRMLRVAGSATIRMARKVKELEAKGEKVVSFTLGEPDFDTPMHVRQAAENALEKGMTHYGPSAGIPEMRAAVAEHSSESNKIPCSADDVLITPTKQAIFMAILALIDDGDEVLLPDPAWVSYEPCISLAGGKCVPVPTSQEDGFQVTHERLAKLVTPRTKMVIINTPSNPTGGVMARECLRGVADLAKDNNLLVLSDEVYERIIYDGEHTSIASLDGMWERTITVSGLSKSFAMTGWRIGWAVAPKSLMTDLGKLQEHSITCIPTFIQKAGVAALTGPDEPVMEMVMEFRTRRDIAMGLLGKISRLQCSAPRGAFYLFPKFDAKLSSEQMADKLLYEGKVAVTAGSAFGASGEGHFRMSYATSRENITEGMKRIAETLT
ncbi:MAG: pyridoxal phosphate-dependent aminotransferase [Euryarchaeota archaeon]|nr:pyridoxal phosphate-dependent aminotransferase [Euryarchaeota archaeon]